MTHNGTPHAVFWDMDGTLVDTEAYWIAAEGELASRYGAEWGDEHAGALVGQALPFAAEYIKRHTGITLETHTMVDMLVDSVAQAIEENGIPWRPGAVELLQELHENGIPNALVTMSYSRLAHTIAENIDGQPLQVIVAGDEVAMGKPHPEPYLKAADALGATPARSVAIEDSIPGLTSAEAAGMYTVGVPHMVELNEAPGRVLWPTLVGKYTTDVQALVPDDAVSSVETP